MKFWLNGLVAVFVVAYPVLVYLGFHLGFPRYIPLALAFLLLLRYYLLSNKESLGVLGKTFALSLSLLGIVICGIAALSNSLLLMKLYPVFVSFLFFVVFASSLFQKQTVIERMARWKEPNLPKAGVRYTRWVTKIWCVFFIINAAIAAYLACFASTAAWAFYAGGLSYLLIAALFLIEYCVRPFFKRVMV
ncbi:MAG: DNA gyrase subunit B [Gammaproteobacteria bacterium CG11_big_fil_rev_8_21_14_0_20_46_22]|nr:MAG: DNA gyrase subunit B [Gammaproteobacteria bacterium CG12_big_fil_rev_8_21_14_0_65_46_12]PIR10076.1 MAG: DNA gyrase subunit B [Gammaproteobacteria bacterium CG11_big_fil_rev_8_21_14_0_20_46_22]